MKRLTAFFLALIIVLAPSSVLAGTDDGTIVLRFDGENDLITGAYGTGYEICANALKLTALGEASPYIELDMTDLSVDCSVFKSVVIVYKVPTYTDGDRLQQNFEFTTSQASGKTGKDTLQKNDKYGVALYDLSYLSTTWKGTLNSLKINWLSKVSEGSVLYIDSIVISTDRNSALASANAAAETANGRTVENIWNDYRKNHLKENTNTYIISDGTLYFRYCPGMLTARSLAERLGNAVSAATGYSVDCDIYSGFNTLAEKGQGNVKYVLSYGERSFITYRKTVIISDSSYHDSFDGLDPEYLPENYTSNEFLSDGVSLSDVTAMPASSSGLAGHSNHECRVVDTPYGTFAVIPMSDKGDGSFGQINGATATVFKVENGSYTSLWSFTFSNHTTKPNIFYAPDGMVYVCCADAENLDASMYVGYFDPSEPFDGAVETRKAIYYKDGTAPGGYGYGQPILDTTDEKIVFMYCGGATEGHFAWFVYDYTTHSFETGAMHTTLSNTYRHCYLYGFSDGNGGLYVVGGRDVLLSTLGYSLPDVSYAWDEVNLFHFPDIYASQYNMITVNSADYSQQDVMMPTTSNNGHGDAYLDTLGYLHVLTSTRMHGSNRHHNTLYWEYWHTVYDVRTPGENPKPVYNEPVLFNNDAEYSCRMIESSRGDLCIVAMKQNSGNVEIYSVDRETYEKKLIVNKQLEGNIRCDGSIIVSNSRNGSVIDNEITVMMPASSGGTAYKMFSVIFDDKIIGDIDGDGKVNVSDALRLKQCILGKIVGGRECDINGDGKINVTDVNILKKIIVGAQTGL